MDLRSLRYFKLIAELGSITGAAQKLHLAQPSLSRHIQMLEEDLGVSLFTRANRGVSLTAAGHSLLESATRILADVDRTTRELREQAAAGEPSGRVVVGLPPTLCPVLLPPLIGRVRQRFPKIELDIQESVSIVLPERLVEGQIDLAVMAQIGRDRNIVATPLVREELVLLTAPGARPAGPVGPEELAATPLVVTQPILASARNLLDGTGIDLKIELVLNSLEAIRLMVGQAVCRTIMPYAVTRRDQAHGLVAAHRLLDGSLLRPLVLATAAGRRVSAAGTATAAIVKEVVEEVEAGEGFVLG